MRIKPTSRITWAFNPKTRVVKDAKVYDRKVAKQELKQDMKQEITHEEFLALSIEWRMLKLKHNPLLLCPVLERWYYYAEQEGYGGNVGFSNLGKPARWLDYYAITETLEAWLDVQGMTGPREIRDYYRAIMAVYDPSNPIFGKPVSSGEIPGLWIKACEVTERIKEELRKFILTQQDDTQTT